MWPWCGERYYQVEFKDASWSKIRILLIGLQTTLLLLLKLLHSSHMGSAIATFRSRPALEDWLCQKARWNWATYEQSKIHLNMSQRCNSNYEALKYNPRLLQFTPFTLDRLPFQAMSHLSAIQHHYSRTCACSCMQLPDAMPADVAMVSWCQSIVSMSCYFRQRGSDTFKLMSPHWDNLQWIDRLMVSSRPLRCLYTYCNLWGITDWAAALLPEEDHPCE